MPDNVRIAVADDHPVVLDGLAQLIATNPRLQVVSRSGDGSKAIQEILRLVPDIAIVDFRMPGLDGIEILKQIQAAAAPVRVILLAGVLNESEIYAAATLGAAGILFKDTATTLLLRCVEHVADGGTWLSEPGIADAIERGRTRSALWKSLAPRLTTREVELLDLARLGRSNKEIANALQLSEGTVKVHFHNIFRKFGVGSRSEVLSIVAHTESL